MGATGVELSVDAGAKHIDVNHGPISQAKRAWPPKFRNAAIVCPGLSLSPVQAAASRRTGSFATQIA